MKLNYNRLSVLIVCALLSEKTAAVSFDTSLLAGASGQADLSRFYVDSAMPPGRQEMDIYVNGEWKGRYVVQFGSRADVITLGRQDASLLGINLNDLSPSAEDDGQLSLKTLTRGGRVAVDPGTLSLKLTVPQAFLTRAEPGYLSPRFWDEGISALLFSYNATYYNTRSKDAGKDTNDDLYAGIQSGANLLGWQFRDNSTWRKRSGESGAWQNNTRYLRRPIATLKSNLTAGDFYTGGDLFDSQRVRGVSLSSDPNMRPNSERGFSPVVRGTAQTNALVKISQNGNVIYQENVPPGAFVIDSIQPTGSAGDLLVSVTEADGSSQSFTVPFSAVPGMLKENVSQYSVFAGTARPTNSDYQPGFVQATLQYGINNLVTGYGGVIFSDTYKAGLLGAGWNLPIGAVSVDITHARTQLLERSDSGQSLRFAYSKFIDATATNFTLAAYRYSTKGYYSFNDAIYSREGYKRTRDMVESAKNTEQPQPEMDLNTWDALRNYRPKNTFTLNLNQRLGKNLGTVFVSGTQRDYWSASQTSREYQLGYSNAVGQVSYSLSASRVRNNERDTETRFYVSLTLPFSLFDNHAWVTAGLSATDSRFQQSNISLSGSAMDSNQLSYTLAGSNQRGGNNMASANANWRSSFSTLGGGYSESSDYRQTGLSSRGSIVAIPGHILASNDIGNTLTIVEAPKAQGMMVNGDESIVTNSSGLALVPYATPYRKNTITLAQTDRSSGAEVKGNIANTVPYDGAVSYIHFDTDRRESWQMRAVQKQGTPLPFGAEIQNENQQPVGYVGQASVLYIQAEEKPQRLIVRLREGVCTLEKPTLHLTREPVVCQ